MSQELRQSTSTTKARPRTSGILFASILIVHLAFAMWVSYTALPTEHYPLLGNDSRSYAQMARTLLAEGQFYSENAPQVIAQRPPLFPTLIASAVYLVGEQNGFLAIVVLQTILFAFAIVLVYRIALFWLPQRQSIAIAILLAIEPATWYTTSILLSDTVFFFLLISSVYLLVRPHAHKKETSDYIASAVLMGLATLTRSIAQFFPLAIVFYILFDRTSWKLRLRNATIYCVCFLAIILPWMTWNNYRSHNFVISTDSVAVHYRHTLPEFLSFITHQDAQTIRDQSLARLQQRAQEEHRPLTSLIMEESSRIIVTHPFAYARFHIIKSLPFFLSDGIRETLVQLRILRQEQPNIGNYLLRGNIRALFYTMITTPALLIAFFGALVWLLIWIAVANGVLQPSSRTGLTKRFVLLCVMLTLLQAALIGPASTPRHRIPALPWIFMLAVPGIYAMGSRIRTLSKQRIFRASTG